MSINVLESPLAHLFQKIGFMSDEQTMGGDGFPQAHDDGLLDLHHSAGKRSLSPKNNSMDSKDRSYEDQNITQ